MTKPTTPLYKLPPGAGAPLNDVLRALANLFQAKAVGEYCYEMGGNIATGQMWGKQLNAGIELICWDGQMLSPLHYERTSDASSPMWCIFLTDSPTNLSTGESKTRRRDHGSMAYLYNHHLDLNHLLQNNGSMRIILIRLKPSVWEEVLTHPPASVSAFIQSNEPQFYGLHLTQTLLANFDWLLGQKTSSENKPWQSLIHTLDICSEIFQRFDQRDTQPYKGMLSKDVERLYNAHNLLLADLQVPPILKDICKQVGLGRDKFRQLFRQVYDATPYQYYQQRRMEEAKQLITSGEHSVMDAGYMVGYSHLGHFAQAFKKQFGYLPKDARLK